MVFEDEIDDKYDTECEVNYARVIGLFVTGLLIGHMVVRFLIGKIEDEIHLEDEVVWI